MLFNSCPAESEIIAYIEEGQSSDFVEKHLLECETCQNVFDRLFDSRHRVLFEQIRKIAPVETIRTNRLPDRIAVYKLHEMIGQGGMGIVYKAVHTELNRPVAVKVIRKTTPHLLDRFQREKNVAGRLNHPNIVATTDAGTWHGRPYLVSELLDGSDLRQFVEKEGTLHWLRAVEIMRQATVGLSYLHRQGVIHRDIKPSNLFLTDEGNVKILDVGLARLLDDPSDGDCTMTGDILGSYDYIAPEQIRNTKKADERSDIYSLGCTFYFLLTGKPPYFGVEYETQGEKIAAHLAPAEIPDVRRHCRAIPTDIAQLIAGMVVKKPDRRLATTALILDRLERVRAAGAVMRHQWTPVGAWSVIGTAALLILLVVAITSIMTMVISFERGIETTVSEPEVPPSPFATVVRHADEPLTTENEFPVDLEEGGSQRRQSEIWNPGVPRPSNTIRPIPSINFNDEDDE